MASLKSRSQQFPVPNEPGEWMAFRRLSEQELQDRMAEGTPNLPPDDPKFEPPGDLYVGKFSDLDTPERFELALAWLKACLVKWSYEEPCTEATCREFLDRPTLVWAFMKAMSHSLGMETAEEKKADSPGSTPISTASPAPAVPATGS
jgi:hypothetical protein